MKITIIVKQEHADLLYKACKGEIDVNDEKFRVDWSEFSNYAKGFLTVQIDYEMYIKLLDSVKS
jgi:hypothetical protein